MDEQTRKEQAQQIVDRIKELVKEGGASRVLLKRKGETLLNLSLNVGVIGAVVGLTAAPFAVLTAALISFGLDCEIEIEKKDGTVLNLNHTELGEKLGGLKDVAVDKAKDAFEKAQTAFTEPAADPEDA